MTLTLAPNLRGDQRAYFVGKTRSGKSFMARQLLKLARSRGWRVAIIDPKRDWMGRGTARRKYSDKVGTVDSPVLVTSFNPKLAVQIIQPHEWNEQIAQFCMDIMATGNTIVYFDEITQLVSTASHVPREFGILWTQGAAINVGAWCSTQRPRNVPVIVKDQAEIWFVFRISNRKDRETIAEFVPSDETPELVEKPLPYHYFYFWEDSMLKPVLFKPLRVGNGEHSTTIGGQYKP